MNVLSRIARHFTSKKPALQHCLKSYQGTALLTYEGTHYAGGVSE